MYVHERTWLERGPILPRNRGFGQVSVSGGIPPGNACYDSSHDPSSNHCGTLEDSLLSVLNPFGTTTVTTCSASESACIGAAAPSPLGGSTPATATVAPPSGGIAPGTACYDASHDGGQIHCASWENVLLSAIPGSTPMTTACSAAELACLQTTPQPQPSAVNWALWAALGLGLVLFIPLAMKR
jgi:hypothetical protein